MTENEIKAKWFLTESFAYLAAAFTEKEKTEINKTQAEKNFAIADIWLNWADSVYTLWSGKGIKDMYITKILYILNEIKKVNK